MPIDLKRDDRIYMDKYKHKLNDTMTKQRKVYQNEHYRILVNTIKDYAIFMLDCDGYIVTWNTGAALLKQYTSDEIIGRHFSIFYGETDRANGYWMALPKGRLPLPG
jgi:PAS domain-containing protein